MSFLTPIHFRVPSLIFGPLVAKYLDENGVSETFWKNYWLNSVFSWRIPTCVAHDCKIEIFIGYFWMSRVVIRAGVYCPYSWAQLVYGSLKSLIVKMFANSKSIAILVNSYRKKAFWSNGSSYPGYREYTIDKLLEALEIILFNTYIQFYGTVFKQILGIPMGGNASPLIADLYLSWCEYCYVTKLTKTEYNLLLVFTMKWMTSILMLLVIPSQTVISIHLWATLHSIHN